MKGTCDICGEHDDFVVACDVCMCGACRDCEHDFRVCQCDRDILQEQSYRIWSLESKIDLVNTIRGFEQLDPKRLN